jgi:hypothetical protein
MQEYVLFDQQQVYKVDPQDVGLELLRPESQRAWILVDALACPGGIPFELLSEGGPTSMFVYSSSPCRSRWRLANQSNIPLSVIIMNPWSKWEAELL